MMPRFRSLEYEVFCHICGKRYLEQDPDVRFLYVEHVWECADGCCRDR